MSWLGWVELNTGTVVEVVAGVDVGANVELGPVLEVSGGEVVGVSVVVGEPSVPCSLFREKIEKSTTLLRAESRREPSCSVAAFSPASTVASSVAAVEAAAVVASSPGPVVVLTEGILMNSNLEGGVVKSKDAGVLVLSWVGSLELSPVLPLGVAS